MKPVVRESCYIFPELPEELGRECLLRVPYEWHDDVRAVSRRWKEVVNSPQFYQDRKRFGMLKRSICLIQHSNNEAIVYHPSQNSLPLPHIPVKFGILSHSSEYISVNDKLFFMGGFVRNRDNKPRKKLIDTVIMYNFSSKQWVRRARMPTARAHFACAVSPEGLIYIAGGESCERMVEREAAVYDTEENRWEILPGMIQGERKCCGAFLDGKFFVITEGCAQFFDVKSKTWTVLEDPLRSCSVFLDRNFVTAQGRLYWFEGPWVMECSSKENALKLVDLSPLYYEYSVVGKGFCLWI